MILGGGPACVSDDPGERDADEAAIHARAFAAMRAVLDARTPYLGCCYGLGVLAGAVGGRVGKGAHAEPVGVVACALTPEGEADPLLSGLGPRFDAFVGHKEAVQALPAGAATLATSAPCPVQAMRWRDHAWAVQFHPEADGDVFEGRIRLYAGRGYFAPEEADGIIAACHAATATVPPEMLRRFVARCLG